MLVRCQLEVSFVDLCDLPQASLEVLFRLVLHTAVLDEGSVVVSAIPTSDPTKFINIAGEVERASRLELVPQSSFNFRLEVLETHTINSVLEPCVLTTTGASIRNQRLTTNGWD